jgi:hypothetical protein
MRNYKKVMIIGMSLIVLQALTMASYAKARDGLFFSLDTDQDGFLSLREAAGSAKILVNFTRVDINKDGHLSMEELHFSPILK